jgi:hypothetical protein
VVNEDSSVDLFPNPTTGRLQINSSDFELNSNNVLLFDLTGRQYEVSASGQGTTLTLDCSFLQAGVYFIKVQSLNEEFTLRFVKE